MSDAESDTEEVQWLLGFVEDAEPAALLRHRFPCKVGGRPAWLDPVHLPTAEQLTCKASGRPLDFLLQIYATPPAFDRDPAAFHRTMFLFISPQGDQLAKSGAARAFRSQLPRSNMFYSVSPPRNADKAPAPLSAAKAAPDRWRVTEYEAAVAARSQLPELPGMRLYPEAEIVVEPEEEGDAGGAGGAEDPGTQRLLREYAARQEAEGALTPEELPAEVLSAVEQSATAETRHFAGFAAAVASAPEQVLRYCHDPAAVPLWPSMQGVPSAADIPECSACGAPRQFEFQVLPQLLNHLDINADAADAPDWGAIAVYTCSASCAPPAGDGYLEEFVWVQTSP